MRGAIGSERCYLGVLQHDVRIIGLLLLRISSWSTSN
jgi:hypothetical protein